MDVMLNPRWVGRYDPQMCVRTIEDVDCQSQHFLSHEEALARVMNTQLLILNKITDIEVALMQCGKRRK